jgi:hypothetical protein
MMCLQVCSWSVSGLITPYIFTGSWLSACEIAQSHPLVSGSNAPLHWLIHQPLLTSLGYSCSVIQKCLYVLAEALATLAYTQAARSSRKGLCCSKAAACSAPRCVMRAMHFQTVWLPGQELTVSYLGREDFAPAGARKAVLQERFGFDCDCQRCRWGLEYASSDCTLRQAMHSACLSSAPRFLAPAHRQLTGMCVSSASSHVLSACSHHIVDETLCKASFDLHLLLHYV